MFLPQVPQQTQDKSVPGLFATCGTVSLDLGSRLNFIIIIIMCPAWPQRNLLYAVDIIFCGSDNNSSKFIAQTTYLLHITQHVQDTETIQFSEPHHERTKNGTANLESPTVAAAEITVTVTLINVVQNN